MEKRIYSTLDKENDNQRQIEFEAEYDKEVKRLKEFEKEKQQANDKRNKIETFISSLKEKIINR